MRIVLAVLAVAACGGSGGGGGGPGGDPDAPPPANSGYVTVSTYVANAGSMPIQGGSVSASFVPASGGTPCTSTVMGACTLYTCPASVPTPTYASAGTVTVTGAAQPATLMPDASNSYKAFTSMQALFAGGESLTVTGTGAQVPAFSIQLTAPARATVTAPAKPATNTPLAIARTQDLAVAWSGGGAGSMRVIVGGAAGSGTSIMCTYAASAGNAMISSAQLAMLPAGMGSFSAYTATTAPKDMGDWRITAQTFFNSVWSADSSIVAVGATLQ